MDMNYQQRAEYIEKCQRQVDEAQREHLCQVRDIELDILRINLQVQAEITRMWNEACRQGRMAHPARITVAM
jgi:hypothetical protein